MTVFGICIFSGAGSRYSWFVCGLLSIVMNPSPLTYWKDWCRREDSNFHGVAPTWTWITSKHL